MVVDGDPWAVPLFARDEDRLLLHGSTGAGALRHVTAGAPIAFCVTAIDGVVVAESTFESSANYRSAVLRGHVRNLRDDERARALDRLSERILPGRTTEVRPRPPRSGPPRWPWSCRSPTGPGSTRSGPGAGEPAEEHQAWCVSCR
jgi:nitroimidazol reductase NimA-like FMN-containing flavoprotein (pyridoxamine 5'-phosphate oxidase superfamily)